VELKQCPQISEERINSINLSEVKKFGELYAHRGGAGIAQSVWRLLTGWTIRGLNPGRGEIFRTCPDRLRGPPSLLYNGYRVFPGGKAAEAWR